MNFDALRKKMAAEQLAAREITDEKILAAFLNVPRHKFLPAQEQNDAYGDFPLPIGCGQTISQPYMAALMTQRLKLTGSEKVLEIGTGSGYQTAVLAEIVKEVYTIERFVELSKKAEGILKELGYKNIRFKIGDGTLGWQEHAPYDGILVAAAASKAPQRLLEQLADGGRMAIPIGDAFSQTLVVFRKEAGKARAEEICGCAFVPLVEG